ncbi:helix-turn-helix domain-containing protein [Pyxidicoccus xibeiensis]|uniref:helix-turn-helix domain-containing protein n=1 Tax=Pyxidicoccus xibeiensis TaxID=2906759 RepID=UPI0020A7B328|nr:AraC family transcriptional regulator [Pyxidicoccus xibeiensis]MCP3136512.1 AraC family transcriptional regulator [Pyxidicoccus xibeiensis]
MSAGAGVKGYEELAPPAAMAEAVDAFWRYSAPPRGSGAVTERHRIMPDGCTDLILHYRDGGPGTWLADPRLVVVGPMERYVLVDIEPGSVSLGVRFRPGWALPLLGVSPRELCGLSVPVASCTPDLALLQRQLEACASPDAALRRLQDFVAGRLASFHATPGPRAAPALRWLQASGGQVRVATLARTLGMSERTLHRAVLDEAGVPPKLLARVLRFQRALSLLRSGAEADLSAVALACGYADQAHLSREVRDLAGLTPTALLG